MMAKEKIVVVDDEEDILDLLRYNLSKEGYEVSCAGSGEEALRLVQSESPSLMVLDLMLPDIDGFEVARRLKNHPNTRNILILMLTAKGDEADIVTGLEIGADDYMTKPFSPRILLARIRAVMRRANKYSSKSIIRIRDLVIHPGRHEVSVNGKSIPLTVTEFNVLYFLAKSPGWAFSRAQIIQGVHGSGYSVTDRSIDVQIVGLRKKLGPPEKYIDTVRGVGYCFKADSSLG